MPRRNKRRHHGIRLRRNELGLKAIPKRRSKLAYKNARHTDSPKRLHTHGETDDKSISVEDLPDDVDSQSGKLTHKHSNRRQDRFNASDGHRAVKPVLLPDDEEESEDETSPSESSDPGSHRKPARRLRYSADEIRDNFHADSETDPMSDDDAEAIEDSPDLFRPPQPSKEQLKRQKQRKQAAAFRKTETAAEDAAETFQTIADGENLRVQDVSAAAKKSRLRHDDDLGGMVYGAGSLAKRTLRVTSAPLRHAVRNELEESADDNIGIAASQSSISASSHAARLLDNSVRQRNIRTDKNDFTASDSVRSGQKTAQVEQRKKAEIRAFQKKKRQRTAIVAAQKESVASAGGFVESANTVFSVPAKAKKAAVSFISEHKGIVIGLAAGGVLFLMIAVVMTSLASVVQGSGTSIVETTYMSTDEDIYAAENAYIALENALDAQINNIERTHPGYDEYNYQIDPIEHNPYHLISYLQVKYGAFAFDDTIKSEISRLFANQYELSVSENSEMRTRMETVTDMRIVTDAVTGEQRLEEFQYEQEVEYEYKALYVALTNKDLQIAARGDLTNEQLIVFDVLNQTYGNRSYLFDINSLPGSGGVGSSGIQYEIPPEALSDEKFANIIREAEKYLGMPYVWGGKSLRTGFDCSGYVCWVLNHCANGWNVGQKRAKELCRMCIYISPDDARPGDLIFFEKTYETSGASHVGIYVGNGVMIHCGNPIKYSKINTRYFKEHFLCFGRLPFYDD